VGALKGTLHGGAGEAVMRTLMEIGSLDKVDASSTRLRREARFMGMATGLHAGTARGHLEGMRRRCRETASPLVRPGREAAHQVSATKKLIPTWTSTRAALLLHRHPVDLFTPVIAPRASWAGPPICSSSMPTTG